MENENPQHVIFTPNSLFYMRTGVANTVHIPKILLESPEAQPKKVESKTVYTLDTLPKVKTKNPPVDGYLDLKLTQSFETAQFTPSILDPKTGLKKGAQIHFGPVSATITQGYQFRENTKEHSTGMDLVTNNGSVISFTDGEIVEVAVQGTTDPVQAFLKDATGQVLKAAGQYIKVRNKDNTYTYYMHLDPLTKEQAAALLGKQVKRGETFGKHVGYWKGSGTMTGAHIKLKITKNGKHINPVNYILYGKN